MREKLKCIRERQTMNVDRVLESKAEQLVEVGTHSFISKAKYKREIKNRNQIKHKSGDLNSGTGTNYNKGITFFGNNRKRTRGRHFHYQDTAITKVKVGESIKKKVVSPKYKHERRFTTIKKTVVHIFYKALKHLVSKDPITGKEIYVKEGKAEKRDTHVSMTKGDPVDLKTKHILHRVRPGDEDIEHDN